MKKQNNWLAGSARLRWLADSEGLVFRLSSVCALQELSGHWLPLFKSPDRSTSSAFEVSTPASEPFW